MVKKIYISSEERVAGSESDFSWQMPYSERIPQETVVLLDAISITNVFYTVGSHNCNLYWAERHTTPNPDTRVGFKEELAHGNYTPQTLGAHIQTKMNARSQAFGYKNVYTVQYSDLTNKFTVTKTNNTTAPTPLVADFTFWSNSELKLEVAAWAASSVHAYNAMDPRSAYKLLGLPRNGARTDATTHALPNQVNLIPHTCLYLHSSNMGRIGDSCGPKGEQTIIARIPVTAGFGDIMTHASGNAADVIDMSGFQMSNLHFRLCDEEARTLDMHGVGFSFSFLILERE
jgi:hypothetical protein